MPKIGFGLGYQPRSRTVSAAVVCSPLHNTSARLARQQGWYVALGQTLALSHVSDTLPSKLDDQLFELVPNSSTRKVLFSFEFFEHELMSGNGSGIFLSFSQDKKIACQTTVPWSQLILESKSAVVDEEHFEQLLDQEEFAVLGSQPHGETLKQLSTRVPYSPLTLLRRLFLLEQTITVLQYLEKYEPLAAATGSSTTLPGAAYIDPEDLEELRANCFPFPMQDVTQWRLLNFPVPKDTFLELQTDKISRQRELYLWESVLCPFVSTLRFLEGTTQQEVSSLFCGVIPAKYDAKLDEWRVSEDCVSLCSESAVKLDVLTCAGEYAIPVPHSLVVLSKRFPNNQVPLSLLVCNGFAILATLLHRLQKLYFLVKVAKAIDDRCLCHQAYLFIDSHGPLHAYMVETHTWTDIELTKLKPVKVQTAARSADELRSRNPQAPAVLSEYAGVRNQTCDPDKNPDQPNKTFGLFKNWPATFAFLVTVEEVPELCSALVQAGYLHRLSPEHTAIQNWSDPKMAFIQLLASKMALFPSKTRGDDSIAQDCINTHPWIANVLVMYLYVVLFGNIPGVMIRPSHLTRLRLTASLLFHKPRTFEECKDYIINHLCFKSGEAILRASTRVAMHELYAFFLRLIPEYKRVLLSHPHQGVMYLEWFRMASQAGNQQRQRLEQVPLARRSESAMATQVRQIVLKFNDVMIQRVYNLTNKLLELKGQHGTFAEVCEMIMTKHFSSILSRVEITLRTFNVDKTTYLQTGRYPSRGEQDRNATKRAFERDSLTHVTDDQFVPANEQQASQQTQQQQQQTQKSYLTEEQFDDLLLLFTNELRQQPAPSSAEENQRQDAAAKESAEISEAELRRLYTPETGTLLHCYTLAQLRAIHRVVVEHVLFVPALNNPKVHEAFIQMCWRIQRQYGARQDLPLNVLGYFGMSEEVVNQLYMLRIYYRQCCPFNSLETIMWRLWLTRAKETALFWRYLYYIRQFASEQQLLLPQHIAARQLLARQVRMGLTTEQWREYDTAGVHPRLGKRDSNSEEDQKILRELGLQKSDIYCAFYCPKCHCWAHQLAPETDLRYGWDARAKEFVRSANQYVFYTGTPDSLKLWASTSSAVARNNDKRTGNLSLRAGPTASSVFNGGGTLSTASPVAEATMLGISTTSHLRTLVVASKTDDWRLSMFDPAVGCHVCTNDIRRRVTSTIGAKLAIAMLDETTRNSLLRARGIEPLVSLPQVEYYKQWRRFMVMTYLFPQRPMLSTSLNKRWGHVDGTALIASEGSSGAAATEKPKRQKRTSKRSAESHSDDDYSEEPIEVPKKKQTRGKKRKLSDKEGDPDNAEETEKEKEKSEKDEEEDAENQEMAADEMTTANIDILVSFFRNNPKVISGTTLGMQHKQVLNDVRPAIDDAATKLTNSQDEALLCNFPLQHRNMIGRINNESTQYTCVFTNTCFCSVCGILMHALEKRYVTGVGYVCVMHPEVTDRAIPVDALGRLYPPRISSSLEGVVRPQVPLQVQRRYFVTQPVQLMGLPAVWYRAYGARNLSDALGLTDALRGARQTNDRMLNPLQSYCDDCDEFCAHERQNGVKAERPFFVETIRVLVYSRDKNKLFGKRLCYKHYKNFVHLYLQSGNK